MASDNLSGSSSSSPSPAVPHTADTTDSVSSFTEASVTDASSLHAVGLEHYKAGRYEESLAAFSRALESFQSTNDELSLSLAPVYFDYGVCLLAHYQQRSSALSDAVTEKQQLRHIGAGEGGLVGEEDVDDSDEAEANGGEEGAAGSRTADDLEVAWEILETARVIYSRAHATNTTDQSLSFNLARVHDRLGDLFQEQDLFGASYAEFERALELRRPFLDSSARELAGAHMDMAVCALHQAKIGLGLQHYTHAYQAINERILKHTKNIEDHTHKILAEKLDDYASSDSVGAIAPALAALESRVARVSSLWPLIEAERAAIAECAELTSELKERIVDLHGECEREKQQQSTIQQAQRTSHSRSQLPSQSSGFTSQPFDIPKLAFAAPAVAEAPVTMVAVKRRAPAVNPDADCSKRARV